MTALGTALRETPRLAAVPYRRLRTAHPVYVLAWLRNGVLLGIAAAALLYLLVAVQASSDIATAIRTGQAISDISNANAYVRDAEEALTGTLSAGDTQLSGTGSEYLDQINNVSRELTLAAENNGAGIQFESDFAFVQGDLELYIQQSETAVIDAEIGGPLAVFGEETASTSALTKALGNLKGAEQAAQNEQRDGWPVDPAVFWWALLGPLIVVLILTAATARMLARHFRRHASPWLWGSLLLATATTFTAGFLNLDDELAQRPDPLAGHPVTLICAMLLFLAAGVMAHLAYRHRLADYRFRSS